MNKNDFNSYLNTIIVTAAQQKCCTVSIHSQHNTTSKDMCSASMMCKMMMP